MFSSSKGFKEGPDDWIRGYTLAGTKLMLFKGSLNDF